MKRIVVMFVIVALVIITTVLWFMNIDTAYKPADLIKIGVMILVVGFALYAAYRRLTSAKRGEPAEDELSKKIMHKTAAFSYYISIYLWLALGFFSDRLKLETHTIIGIGIMGMAVSFAICWVIINFTGVKNE
jgi:peptidoglycan/LPS O-acetylase OafA/YrhL